jgi:O-antigen/teichoic acid export membrane protein
MRIFGRVHFFRASSTLVDQGVVSIGSFAVNIVLARLLLPVDYGSFSVIFALLMGLQIFNTTLIFYPLTIRIAAAGSDRSAVISSSLTLLVMLLVPLSTVLAVGLILFLHSELVLPVLVWFWSWQLQEAFRRALFSEFRHNAAVLGDAVSYLGQSVVVILLPFFDALTLVNVFWAMAGTSALAAVIQFFQVNPVWRRSADLVAIIKDYWAIGCWSLASSITNALRFNALVWMIAASTSRAEVAEFQATLNVANLANPILFGLCNLIPQTAAHASNSGVAGAWRAARHYAAFGFPPTAIYYAFLIVSPEPMLRLFYGSGSSYLQAGLAVQILGVAFIFNYASEMICSFLHGVNFARDVLTINLLGTAMAIATFLLAFPSAGVVAAAVAIAVSNCVRLIVALASLKRLVSNSDVRPV